MFKCCEITQINGNRSIQASDGNRCVLAILFFFFEKELFQSGWGVFVILEEIPEGWGGGGASVPSKNGKSREVGGS